MDDKLAVPAPAANTHPESEAATIAATSVADEKRSSLADEPSDAEAAPRAPVADSEKHGEQLARHATTASKSGQSITQMRTREDGTEYPTGMKLGLITLALCLSVFLMALDNSIIATAIPKITDQFQSLPDVGWYGSGTSSPARKWT